MLKLMKGWTDEGLCDGGGWFGPDEWAYETP